MAHLSWLSTLHIRWGSSDRQLIAQLTRSQQRPSWQICTHSHDALWWTSFPRTNDTGCGQAWITALSRARHGGMSEHMTAAVIGGGGGGGGGVVL
jgi:hypothetical protein